MPLIFDKFENAGIPVFGRQSLSFPLSRVLGQRRSNWDKDKRHRREICYGTQCAQWVLEDLRYVAPRAHAVITDSLLSQKHLDVFPLREPNPGSLRVKPKFEPRPYQKEAMKMFEKGVDGEVERMLFSMGRRLPRYMFAVPQMSMADLADDKHPFEDKIRELAETLRFYTPRNVGKSHALDQLPFMMLRPFTTWLANNQPRSFAKQVG